MGYIKTIEVHVQDYNNSQEMYLHRLYYLNGVQNIDSVVKPRIEITAIGRGVIEGTIGNLYSSKVNMDHKRMTELKSLSIAGGVVEQKLKIFV